MEFVVILLIGLAVWVWIGFAGVRGRERALRSELDTLRARQGDLAGQPQLLQGRVDALAGSTATAAAAPAPEPEPVPEEAPLSTTVVVPVPAAAYPPPPTSAGAISPAAPPPPPRPSTPAAAAPEPAPGQDARTSAFRKTPGRSTLTFEK